MLKKEQNTWRTEMLQCKATGLALTVKLPPDFISVVDPGRHGKEIVREVVGLGVCGPDDQLPRKRALFGRERESRIGQRFDSKG